jgi:hypothetical protein
LELTETMTTAKTTALTSCIDADLQAAFILAKAANVLTGSLRPLTRIRVLQGLA